MRDYGSRRDRNGVNNGRIRIWDEAFLSADEIIALPLQLLRSILFIPACALHRPEQVS